MLAVAVGLSAVFLIVVAAFVFAVIAAIQGPTSTRILAVAVILLIGAMTLGGGI